MEFVKTHWVSLAAGVASLVFITLAVLGMTTRHVVQKMEERVAEVAELGMLKNDPQNQQTIEAERQRGENFASQYEATLKVAEEFNARRPLLEGVFPRPVAEDLPFRFKDEYIRTLRDLPRLLEGGDLPSSQDVDDAREEIEEIRRLKQEIETEGGQRTGQPLRDPRSAARPGARPTGAMLSAAQSADPNENPELRARIAKARAIRCYVSVDPQRASFHVSPIIEATTPPAPDELWLAQVGLWIQQDLVAAIASVNEEAAQAAEDANVETMPVKRIVAIDIEGYVLPNFQRLGFPRVAAGRSPGPAAQAGPSFTGKVSADPFDVVTFTLEVVVDQRELLKLIDRIGRKNFYQLIGLSYGPIADAEGVTAGYYYGAAPAVRATLRYEAYFSRRIFSGLMPEEIRTALGIAKVPQ